MIQSQITIINKLGLHARAASKFVATASAYQSDVRIGPAGQLVEGKSIMSLLMLAASQGTDLTLEVDGEDEEEAFEAICALIQNRFGEEA